jgi:hypothetical protein
MVTYSNAGYLALQASTPASPKEPDTNPAYWQEMGGVPGATGAAGAGFGGTSSTSLTPGSGNKTFTTQANMAWAVGMPIQATSASTPSSWMAGTVYSYSGTTLIIVVTSYAGGTEADWVFSAPTGAQGIPGATGATGPTGPGATPVPPYMSGLITGPDTSKTILGTTHGIATTALLVVVYDNSTPRNAISAGWSVDPTTYNVVVMFAAPQSNYYVAINGGGSPGASGGQPSGSGMVAVTSGVARLASPNVDYMPAISGTGLLKVSAGIAGLATATVDFEPALGYTPENLASKGAVNGYAPLDSSALVPLANLPSSALGSPATYVASMYNFPAITPGGSLSVGSNTIALPGMTPFGVNGNDTGHYVWISGGTGTAEAVLISGGTARTGMTVNQTLIFTCAYTHTGAWTITSASGGIQEAVNACFFAYPYGGASKVIIDSPYAVNIYAPVYIPTTMEIMGGAQLILQTPSGVAFQVEAEGCKLSRINFSSPAINTQTSGCAIAVGVVNKVVNTWIEGCQFSRMYDGVVGTKSQLLRVTGCYFSDFLHTDITAGDSTNSDDQVLYAAGNTYFNIDNTSPALACIYLTSGWATIIGEEGVNYNSTQTQYGVYATFTASSSGTEIIGCDWGYFGVAGIKLTSTAFYQYVTILGNNIHNEDYTGTSSGIVVGANFSEVTIGPNTIQGHGASFTGVDVTGASNVTLGNNNITFSSGTAGTYVTGYNPWNAPTLLNSWTNQGGTAALAGYKLESVTVSLSGTIRPGTLTNGTTLFVLPAGFRPTADRQLAVAGRDGSNNIYPVMLYVTAATGNVNYYGSSGVQYLGLDSQFQVV